MKHKMRLLMLKLSNLAICNQSLSLKKGEIKKKMMGILRENFCNFQCLNGQNLIF